jgi:hypothetical protein
VLVFRAKRSTAEEWPRRSSKFISGETGPVVVNPFRRSEERLFQHANQAISQSLDTMISHWKLSFGRVLPSGDVDKLVRKLDLAQAFGENTAIKKRTFGVIMHVVDCSRIDPSKEAT